MFKNYAKKKGKGKLCDDLDDDKIEQVKESDKIKKKIRDNLDDKGEQVKESDKIRKKEMRDNLDDNEKGKLKNFDNRRKKEKRDNLDTHENKLLKSYEKKEIENCLITLMMTKENR